jgi:NAD(P)-dependent dehydrogenase (short-subunit alcohol dehydrogenase family)
MSGKWTADEMGDLSGKTFVVTGANSGIGYEAALALASKGGTVVLACRNMSKGNVALDGIRKAVPDSKIELAALDLGSLRSVRDFADAFLRTHERLDVLINNAGVMAIPRRLTEDGFEMQLGTNHLGHFALTGLLLGRIVRSVPARIVNVSSMAHTLGTFDANDLHLERGYAKWAAYGRSKLANLLFTYELERRLEGRHPDVIAVACHPGYAATNLQSVGPEMTGSGVGKAVMALSNALFAQSARRGALPTLYAATAPDVHGGDFIGPDGPFHAMGAPAKQRSNRRSYNLDLAKSLWEASVRVTGVDYALLSAARAA